LSKNIWTWEKNREKILTLRGRLGFPDASVLKFLRFSLSLEDGSIYDELMDRTAKDVEASVYCILTGYAEAEPTPETGKLVSFEQLPGGRAYFNTFRKRTTQQIERVFSTKPQMLLKAAELFDATKLEYGDYSVKFYALPLVPIHVILWSSDLEFPTSASILFDSSVSSYLSTEQIAGIGELSAFRLKQAFEAITPEK
jgi:putative hemolysin